MNDLLKDFISKFKVTESVIKDYQYWTWSLRPVQCTLGAGVLLLKRFAPALSQISAVTHKMTLWQLNSRRIIT